MCCRTAHHATLCVVLLALTQLSLAAVSIVTVTVSAPPAPTSPSFSSDAAFETAMLEVHNFYRREHGVAGLTWNTTSAVYASDWAARCDFKHSHGPTGENLAAGFANATESVDIWGLEREHYDWDRPGFSEITGHFTQLVWSNTTSVGCGRQACEGSDQTPGYYVVCEYFPPGNIVGDDNQYFIDNVKRQILGRSSDTFESGVTSRGSSQSRLRWGSIVLFVASLICLGMTA